MKVKSQSDILSMVLIVIISISLVGIAYTWGLPLIQKRQSIAIVTRVADDFNRNNANSLIRKIETVAKNGGEEVFTISSDGIWIVYPYNYNGLENNSIQFIFFSKVSNVAVNMSEGKYETDPLSESCPPAKGTVGNSTASVVCSRADYHLDGFNITYKVFFRDLIDEQANNIYGIKLVGCYEEICSDTGDQRSTQRTIRIRRDEPPTKVGNLIITKVKIILG